MTRPIERVLFAVVCASVAALLVPVLAPVRKGVVGGSADAAARSIPVHRPEAVATPTRPEVSTPTASGRDPAPGGRPIPLPTPPHPATAPGSTPAPGPAPEPATAAATRPDMAEPPDPRPDRAPVRCPRAEQLWFADGYPVEDTCTLAEVRRVFQWAWTGTDGQRRAAIRNGYLLDEVFAALDGYGRDHDGYARLFDPDERGRFAVLFDDIRWRGGPGHDRAVIGVSYRFDHPEMTPTEPFLDTAVQIDGKWRLSYRRSYCPKVMAIMEYLGSDLRCPRDPRPEVNEDEAPGATGSY